MWFPYFLFPHPPDQVEAKEDAVRGLHRVENKDTWARGDVRKDDTQDIQQQSSRLTGSGLISTRFQAPARMEH